LARRKAHTKENALRAFDSERCHEFVAQAPEICGVKKHHPMLAQPDLPRLLPKAEQLAKFTSRRLSSRSEFSF
jgi:hypothetical protein